MRPFGTPASQAQTEVENPYWLSFSDIMAGLLVIFILASIALILELAQIKAQAMSAIEELNKAEQVRRDLLHEIRDRLNAQGVPVTLGDDETVLRLPESVLSFDPGQFKIPNDKAFQQRARLIGQVIHESIQKDQRWKYLDTLFVEGHTDNRPFSNRRLKGNWGLSAFRAIALWDFWNSELPDDKRLAQLKNKDGNFLFSVGGYAETRPIQIIQETKAQRRRNRRIDIRFTVVKPSMENFQKIRQVLE